MLWNENEFYELEPFDLEIDLEESIIKVAEELFSDNRIYLDTKKKIGAKGKKKNIPDGYLLDLTSVREPKIYVVENELAKHDPLKHIAVQILEFSLAYESSPQKVKEIVKEALSQDDKLLIKCKAYAEKNGFENVDYLLETIIHSEDSFNALVIIDEISEDLEKVLISKFKFPVEVLTLQRFKSNNGKRLYQFEPFLKDVSPPATTTGSTVKLDPSEIDTIVVPARDEGFDEVFMGEDCWYSIRIHSSMIPKIKNIAAYRVAPISAITHIAKVSSIERWKDTNKYVLKFSEPAEKIGPIELKSTGTVKAPQAPRYTSRQKLQSAASIDDAF